jgi:hypothetical protein
MLTLILATAMTSQIIRKPGVPNPPPLLARPKPVLSQEYQEEVARRAKKSRWDAAVQHDRWYGTSYAELLAKQEIIQQARDRARQEAERRRKEREIPYFIARPGFVDDETVVATNYESDPIRAMLSMPSEGGISYSSISPATPMQGSNGLNPLAQTPNLPSYAGTSVISYQRAYQNLLPNYWGGGGTPQMAFFMQQQFHRAISMPMTHHHNAGVLYHAPNAGIHHNR